MIGLMRSARAVRLCSAEAARLDPIVDAIGAIGNDLPCGGVMRNFPCGALDRVIDRDANTVVTVPDG